MSLKASCIFHLKKNRAVNLKIFSNTFSWPILPIKMEKLQIFEEIDGLTLSSFLTSCFYSLKRLFLFVPFPYLRARTIETSSLPTNSSWPLFKQIEIFFLIYWLYISTISTFLHIRASLMLETASCTRINDIIRKKLILHIWTWCSLRWYNYFFAALCIGQIEASTCPPRAFDSFAVPGRREFDYQSLPGGEEFDPHALGVGNLNCTLDFM